MKRMEPGTWRTDDVAISTHKTNNMAMDYTRSHVAEIQANNERQQKINQGGLDGHRNSFK